MCVNSNRLNLIFKLKCIRVRIRLRISDWGVQNEPLVRCRFICLFFFLLSLCFLLLLHHCLHYFASPLFSFSFSCVRLISTIWWVSHFSILFAHLAHAPIRRVFDASELLSVVIWRSLGKKEHPEGNECEYRASERKRECLVNWRLASPRLTSPRPVLFNSKSVRIIFSIFAVSK